MTPTPRTDEVRGQIAERYNGHGSMSIAYTEMGKWADKLERELEETNANYKLAHSELGAHVLLLASHKAALEKAREKLDAAQRAMPAYHEGGLFIEHHDPDGTYTGCENVDPITVVQWQSHAIDEALTAINELNKLQQPTLL